jgi:hypothetical protein
VVDLDVPLGLPSPDIDLDPGPGTDIGFEVGLELLTGELPPETDPPPKNPPAEVEVEREYPYDGEGDLVFIAPKELKNDPKPSLEEEMDTAGVWPKSVAWIRWETLP